MNTKITFVLHSQHQLVKQGEIMIINKYKWGLLQNKDYQWKCCLIFVYDYRQQAGADLCQAQFKLG